MGVTEIEFVWDSRQLGVFLEPNIERAAARALSMAGGDAIRALRSSSTERVRGLKRMKLQQIKKSLPLTFPSNRGEISGLVWTMKVSGKGMRIAEYPSRQVKKGVSVQINTGGERKTIKSAFIAVLRSGHKGVFKRRGKARLPIEELYTTKVSDVFKDAGFIPAVQGRALEVFTSSFARLLPLELDKIKAK